MSSEPFGPEDGGPLVTDKIRASGLFVAMFVAVICAGVGTGSYVLVPDDESTGVRVSVFSLRICRQGRCFDQKVEDIPNCDELKRHLKASAAFCIVSIVAAAVSVIGCALELADKVQTLGVVAAGVYWAASLVAWAPIAGIYNKVMCGVDFQANHGRYGPGFALMVVGWVLSLFGIVLWVVRQTQLQDPPPAPTRRPRSA